MLFIPFNGNKISFSTIHNWGSKTWRCKGNSGQRHGSVTATNKRLVGSSARTLGYLMFKGLALSPTLWFMSYVASVTRLLWRKQACCSSRRSTVIGGQILPAGNSAFTTTSTSLAVVQNGCDKGINEI